MNPGSIEKYGLMNALERVKELVAAEPVVLFMKGTPQSPGCGFSSRIANILALLDVPFVSIDVLRDDEIRQAIKTHADWPTIPQLYLRSEFVGGCDIVSEMFQSGELAAIFAEKDIPVSKRFDTAVIPRGRDGGGATAGG